MTKTKTDNARNTGTATTATAMQIILIAAMALLIMCLPACSSKAKSDIASTMTPQDATVVINASKSLTMHSNQPLPDLITFYDKALKKLEAEQTSRIETKGWYYAGRYDDNKFISVSITDLGDKRLIVVTY
ncbi:MAG: hypothetical protein FWF88_09815 [Peptococcaceae bacterium]|nr:hypothetical protein [Peptococcaceae bacterium]